MRSPVAELLADLARAFDAAGIRWYLFGAQAAIVYGVARLTADVDVTAKSPSPSAAPCVEALERHGFDRRFGDTAFIADTRVVPMLHRATALPVDIVLAGPGLEEQFLQRAGVREIDGVAVPVIDLADLIALKILAGRAKDLEDVTTLCRIHRDALDVDRVRDVLAMLEAALGQSDLLRTFEQCRDRAR